MKKQKVSKVFNKRAEHQKEHLHWEFSPSYPSQPGEIGLPQEYSFTTSIKSICGGIDDSQPVESYDGKLGVPIPFVLDHQAPVGLVRWNDQLDQKYNNPGNVSNVRWASGTLISRDLFLTTGHTFDCFPNPKWSVPRINGTNNPISPQEIALNMHVDFNFQRDVTGRLRRFDSYPILELLEYRPNGLDFAIVRLGGNPGDKYGFARISERDAIEREMLCIIQHPEGLPKRIDAGPLFHIHDDRLGYDTIDTMGGSSGSGILSSLSGLLVGIHTNGGCDDKAIGHNHGLRISSIIANSPIVRSVLDQKWQFEDLSEKTSAPKIRGRLNLFHNETPKSIHVFYCSRSGKIQELCMKNGQFSHTRWTKGLSYDRPRGLIAASFEKDWRLISYRGNNSQIYAMQKIQDWKNENLTQLIKTTESAGNPFLFYDPHEKTGYISYRDKGGNIQQIRWKNGWFNGGSPSIATGAVKAKGDPLGYYNPINHDRHLFYPGTDQKVHHLHWNGQWKHKVLPIPKIRGELALCGKKGNIWLAYRSSRGQLIFAQNTPRWEAINVSDKANLPKMKGDPGLYFTGKISFPEIICLGKKGHLFRLWKENRWAAQDITASSEAPKAKGRPVGFFDPKSQQKHIVFRGRDNRVYCLKQ